MLKAIATLFAILLLATVTADAQVCRLTATTKTVQGSVETTTKTTGTAFYIGHLPDGQSAWLAAGHLVEKEQTVVIEFEGSLVGKAIATSKTPDLALIAAPGVDATKHQRFVLADKDAADGAVVAMSGFSGLLPRDRHCSADGYLHDGTMLFCGLVDSGDSGGPVFHKNTLYGVVTGKVGAPNAPVVGNGPSARLNVVPVSQIRKWLLEIPELQGDLGFLCD